MTVSKLFTPIRIGSIALKHRVVLAPLTRFRNTGDHVPNELLVEYYKQRAGNGGGLLITEATFISPMAGGYPGAPGIYTKDQVEGWKKVTEAVHQQGSAIFQQLWHVGRATSSSILPNNATPVSASAIAINGNNMAGQPYGVPRALEESEIPSLIQDYINAAKNAIEAGFDGVEIHGANGYIIDQFINSNSNVRTDKYGGSIENRTRLALEVVDAIQQAIGPERTAIRFSPWGAFQDMGDETPLETWGYLTQQLQDNHPNLAYLHFVEPRPDVVGVAEDDKGPSLKSFRKIWKSAFISAGGFGDHREHALAVAEETGNLLAYGRHFIANPDLPYRLQENLPLNPYNRDGFYAGGAVGYTDYPTWEETQKADSENTAQKAAL
ncbi:hypothetical protein INT44_005933 [Umbelopsis vinacea]|uniref:NADH:flavin oxidoreductase/NADH oxidase N-terminal domain-containing protein n=1 Tax=Umbelopsis vinacea TaxID=44442 RepID=A0A8H7PYV8_9FUNG|nr:hypothetical protein INT44_005933 [Umbelopsis vinacea]